MAEVEIEHDNSGAGPGWHCEQVVVYDESSNRSFAFPCDRCVCYNPTSVNIIECFAYISDA